MITKTHPTPADLLWYAVTSDQTDPRVKAVRDHLQDGCEICVVAVLRLKETTTDRPFRTPASVLDPGWVVPRRVAIAGTRGSQADLHLICGAGPYELDILMREGGGPQQLEMVGQVTRAGRIFEPVADLTMKLIEAQRSVTVASTRTDSFGEFDLLSPHHGRYGVRLGDDADAPCVLVWEGAAA